MSASRFFRAGGFSFGAFFLVALMVSSIAIFSGCKKKEEMPPKEEAPAAAPETAAPEAAGKDPAREHFNKGVKYSLMGQYDEAIKEYKLTLEINPASAETYS